MIGLGFESAEFTARLAPDALAVTQFSYQLVTEEAGIRALIPQIANLQRQLGQADDVTLAPEYFLEKNELGCAPILVLILQGKEPVAVLYGRERRVLGIRTGLVQFGDYYGDTSIIAREEFKASALSCGALQLFDSPRIHTIRASFKLRDEHDIASVTTKAERAAVNWKVLPETVHHRLALNSTFDGFLKTLGSHTRRNLRVYRRRVEQRGWKFISRLNPEQSEAAFLALEGQQRTHRSSSRYLNCCRAALNAVPGSFYAGICTETGEWVSVAAGWLRSDRYFMLVQLNDGRYSRDSISTVMRSYLIEHLIGLGVKTINFVGGSSELLRRFCTPQLCGHFLFEKKDVFGTVRRFAASLAFRHSMMSRIIRGSTGDSEPVEDE